MPNRQVTDERQNEGDWPKVYAWTPGTGGYKHYPQYANFKLFEDGRCVVTVRGPEFRNVGDEFYQMGETVCISLPPEVAAELRAFFAQGDAA
jgi:hypothetical protein